MKLLIFPAFALLFGVTQVVASPPLFKIVPSGEAVSSAELLDAICLDWVELTATDAGTVKLWDVDLEVRDDSRLLLGANSVYFYALSLSGEFRVGKQKVTAGKMMVWKHYGYNGGKALVYSYSAERLATVFGAKGFPEDADLASIEKSQKVKRFWGFLRPTGVNVAAPVAHHVEESRVFYQTNPAIIGLKRASGTKEEYFQNTVIAFVDALATGEASMIAVLLSPSLFLQGASSQQIQSLLIDERRAFANHLISTGNYQGFGGAKFTDVGNGKYTFEVDGRMLTITLQPFDDGVYVTSLKSE